MVNPPTETIGEFINYLMNEGLDIKTGLKCKQHKAFQIVFKDTSELTVLWFLQNPTREMIQADKAALVALISEYCEYNYNHALSTYINNGKDAYTITNCTDQTTHVGADARGWTWMLYQAFETIKWQADGQTSWAVGVD